VWCTQQGHGPLDCRGDVGPESDTIPKMKANEMSMNKVKI
jgi:hypothetical protein